MTRDCFGDIYNDPTLWGPLDSAKLRLEAILKAAERESDYLTQLAILRVERVRLIGEPSDLASRLSRIKQHVDPNDEYTTVVLSILQCELELHSEGSFAELEPRFLSLRQQLRSTSHDFLYGIVAHNLSIIKAARGELDRATEFNQEALGVFRRLSADIQVAHALIATSRILKGQCRYYEAERTEKAALKLFDSLGTPEGRLYVFSALSVLRIRVGDVRGATSFLRKCRQCLEDAPGILNDRFANNHNVNRLHVLILEREFEKAHAFYKEEFLDAGDYDARQRAIVLEFLGEAMMEAGDLEEASLMLDSAFRAALSIAPAGDLMTETLRRKADVALRSSDCQSAVRDVSQCIRLSRRIDDKYELGAALRILGQCHAANDNDKKAISAFEAGINTLKAIGECYELMRTCIAYADFLIEHEDNTAELYILEAEQLCKKVELDFFMCQIKLLSSKLAKLEGDFGRAQSELKRAEELCSNIQECDANQVRPKIEAFAEELETAIIDKSMESSKRLRSVGKLYQDARFPIEDLKPEMAAEIAVQAGASGLFIAKPVTKGLRIPIRYNYSADAARALLTKGLLGVKAKELLKTRKTEINPVKGNKTLVVIPGSENGYALCAVFDGRRDFEPSELEYLFASIEALEQVAEEYGPAPTPKEVGHFLDDDGDAIKHPGGSFKSILTIDPEMIKTIRLAERAAKTGFPILLEGETGVGKELFAQAIHDASPRSDGPFVALNAGGVPIQLLESQLFGHVKGAFTDAVTDRTGLIEDARGGTIFFDEVGEMSEELQVKLLRLLENGEYRRLGENEVRKTNVRVVSATNRDLKSAAEDGLFRDDLYYRLAPVRFRIPPLRDRTKDIEFLIRHFLQSTLRQMGTHDRMVTFDMKAMEAFELYSWPGNVRELRNEVSRLLALLGETEVIRFGMLSENIIDAFNDVESEGHLEARVNRYEKRIILKALEDNEWNRVKTAEQIGIPRTTLLFRMKKLNIGR